MGSYDVCTFFCVIAGPFLIIFSVSVQKVDMEQAVVTKSPAESTGLAGSQKKRKNSKIYPQ